MTDSRRVDLKALLSDAAIKQRLVEGAANFICEVEGINRPDNSATTPGSLAKALDAALSSAPLYGDVSAVLRVVASFVEKRGEQGLDLDPGETADWLRSEADLAEAGNAE